MNVIFVSDVEYPIQKQMGLLQVQNMINPYIKMKKEIKIERVWAMPNAWTFSIKPINELLKKYVKKEEDWIDPFAGKFSPAKWTNDWNPERNARFCLDANDFAEDCERLTGRPLFDGILFDPPYSNRQISEHYKAVGKKATALDTSANFYSRIKSKLSKKIRKGGYAISCGWNTVGFGKKNGFEIVEILIVSHGGAKNDTLVTVEQKL